MEMPVEQSHLSFIDVFNVGVKEIDDQHNQLLVFVNDLHEEAIEGLSNERYRELADIIINFAKVHFATEEALMQKLPHEADNDRHVRYHLAMHEKLIATLYDVSQMPESLEASQKLISFLRMWLVDHILNHDIELGKRLNAIGVH